MHGMSGDDSSRGPRQSRWIRFVAIIINVVVAVVLAVVIGYYLLKMTGR